MVEEAARQLTQLPERRQKRQEYTKGKRQDLQYMVLGNLESWKTGKLDMQRNEAETFSYTINKNKLKVD